MKLSSQNGCAAAVTVAAIGRARIDMHGSVSYRFLHRHHLNQDFKNKTLVQISLMFRVFPTIFKQENLN